MPQISVIVPVYKVEEYLHRCIDSILAQTFKDFELILVDDGSPDNCPIICDEYKAKDSRIIVIHQQNGGLSAARNTAIDWAFSNSDSEWLTFIDSDDWIHPRYLERLYNACIDNNVNISVCDYISMVGDATAPIEDEQLPQIIAPEDFWCENKVCATVAWGKIYKKELWENIRYPEGEIHEDEYTTYKLLFSCPNLAFIQNKMYYYFQNTNGIMAEKWTPKRLNQIYATKEQFENLEANGYHQAAKKSLELYFYYILDNIDYTKNKRMYKAEYKGLRKEFKKFLNDKKGYFEGNNISISWILYRIYPLFRFSNTLKATVKKVIGFVKK